MIRIKEEQFQKAFHDAGLQLDSVRTDPSYPVIFQNLAGEALEGFGGQGVQVHVDKRDLELCRKTLAGLNVAAEIVPDCETRGGLVVTTADGSIIVSNTVESRLERGKERLKKEVYGILFGS